MLMKEAISVFGTKKRLAEVLGIAYQSVKQWRDDIPENREAHVRSVIELQRMKDEQEQKKVRRRKPKAA